MIPGTTFAELLPMFEADAQTEVIVLIGEIGGSEEEVAAQYIRAHVTKPVRVRPRDKAWGMPAPSWVPAARGARRRKRRRFARPERLLPRAPLKLSR